MLPVALEAAEDGRIETATDESLQTRTPLEGDGGIRSDEHAVRDALLVVQEDGATAETMAATTMRSSQGLGAPWTSAAARPR